MAILTSTRRSAPGTPRQCRQSPNMSGVRVDRPRHRAAVTFQMDPNPAFAAPHSRVGFCASAADKAVCEGREKKSRAICKNSVPLDVWGGPRDA